MWFLRAKASPDPDGELAGKYGGANVCCWVDTDEEGEALAAADEMLRFYGWVVGLAVDESHAVERHELPEKSVEFFDLARAEGFAHVAVTWPVDQ